MDMRLLDEMAGAEVPPSPSTYKQRADDRMWAELGKGDSDETSPKGGVDGSNSGGSGAPSGSGSGKGTRGSGGGGSSNRSGARRGHSRSRRRRRDNAFETDSKRGGARHHTSSSFRWTEKRDEEGDGDDAYFSFGDEDELGGGGDNDDDDDLGPLRIKDLDVFFTHVYTFFKEKGLWCMVTSRLVNLVNLGFTIFFSTFLFLFVDWQALSVCGEDETLGGCGNFSSYVDWGLTKSAFTFWHGVVVFYFVTFCVFWLWTLYSFFPVLKYALEMHTFYTKRLRISTRQLQTMHWNDVVERLVALHRRQRIQLNKAEITAHDIACRIMRRENYLIAMYNQQVFNLRVPGIYGIKNHCYRQAHRAAAIARRKVATYGWALPNGGGLADGGGGDGGVDGSAAAASHEAEINIPHTRGFFLTNHLQWNIEFCVMNHMFDRKKQLETNFIHAPRKLQQRFVLVGIANFVLMPFTLIFMIVYFFMRHAEALHNNKEYLGPREYSPHAKWLFREFNELPHFFEDRLNLSYESADKYDKQFATPLLSIVARCVSYITGGVVALLVILALIDDNILLQVTVYDRNLLWYSALFGGMLAISRSFISEREKSVLDPNAAMRALVKHTHYMDEKWRGRCHTYDVRDSFLQLYRFKLELFCMELVSVVFSPLILCFSLPKSAHYIVNFIETFSVNTGGGAGHVLGYSLFDFARFGDVRYGAPHDGPKDVRLAQGKLEKSFLSFKQNHPTWQPDALGRSVIHTLNRFRSEALGVTFEGSSSASSTDDGSSASSSSSAATSLHGSSEYSQHGDRSGVGGGGAAATHGDARGRQARPRQPQQDMESSIFFVKRTENATGEIVPADKQPNAFYWLDKYNESQARAGAARRWREAQVAAAMAHSSSQSSLTASMMARQQQQLHAPQQQHHYPQGLDPLSRGPRRPLLGVVDGPDSYPRAGGGGGGGGGGGAVTEMTEMKRHAALRLHPQDDGANYQPGPGEQPPPPPLAQPHEYHPPPLPPGRDVRDAHGHDLPHPVPHRVVTVGRYTDDRTAAEDDHTGDDYVAADDGHDTDFHHDMLAGDDGGAHDGTGGGGGGDGYGHHHRGHSSGGGGGGGRQERAGAGDVPVSLSREFQGPHHGGAEPNDLDLDLPEEFV